MRDWKQMGLGVGIPSADLETIAPTLEALEAAFRPLAAAIPDDVEPAVTFSLPEEEA